MKKFRFLSLFLIALILCGPFLSQDAMALEAPAISSPTALVIDANTGDVLFSQNADQRIYPASTTKIMTVLLAVEAVEDGLVSINDEITTTSSMNFDLVEDGSSAGIMVGETLTLESLLYCAMVSSANEACNVIGEYISGSVSSFVELMNRRASELGCTGTHFTNTHGLPDENHYTTAADMALIAGEAAGHDLFMRLCTCATVEIPATNLSGARLLKNSNALICDQSIYGSKYLYEPAGGIKTGHTSAAGYCLVSTSSSNDINLLTCVFGGAQTLESDGTYSYANFADTITLDDWVFNNFSYQEILKSSENVASVEVSMGADADGVNLRPANSIHALLPNDYSTDRFTYEITIYSQRDGEELVAPISAGKVLGELNLVLDGRSYGTVELVAASSVELSHFQFIKAQISDTLQSKPVKIGLTVLIILVLLYLALVIYYRVKRLRHLQAVRAAKLEKARRMRESQAAAVRSNSTRIDFFTENGISEEAPPPAQSPAPPRPAIDIAVPDEPAQANSSVSDRDYFEEFFRQK